MRRESWQAPVALVAVVAALALPVVAEGTPVFILGRGVDGILIAWVVGLTALFMMRPTSPTEGVDTLFIAAHAGAFYVITLLPAVGAIAARPGTSVVDAVSATPAFWALAVASWALAWLLVTKLSAIRPLSRVGGLLLKIAIPAIFGVWLLLIWEVIVRGFGVPPVLLPPPSAVGAKIATSLPTLWADFRQLS